MSRHSSALLYKNNNKVSKNKFDKTDYEAINRQGEDMIYSAMGQLILGGLVNDSVHTLNQQISEKQALITV